MALLELEHVEARYGPIKALHGVSLARRRRPGRLAARRERRRQDDDPARDLRHVRKTGEIAFAGKKIGGRPPESVARLGIAHVPEGRGIYSASSRSGRTCCSAARCAAAAARSSATPRRALEHFPRIKDRRRQQAGTLSGGEQQMLALARALVSRPRLLMLDEPSLGLAPTAVQELYRVVRHLNQEEGLTVLVVEQNARIALAVHPARLRARGRAGRDGRLERGALPTRGRPRSYLGY